MFDIGMTELLLIGIVALIVVGPKDLPGMFRTLGRFTAKARSLGREFTRAMNEAADETGVKDVAKDLRKATDPKRMGLDALKDAADKFEKWEPAKPAKPAAERGGETAKLAREREEAKQKILDATARKASERIAREKAEAEAAATAADEAPAAPEKTAPEEPAPKPRRKSGKPKPSETNEA